MDMIDQRVEEGQCSSEEPHEGGSAAAAASSSGRQDTKRGTKRSTEEAEYPQWQFKRSTRKSQWQAYEKKINEELESAYSRTLDALELVIDNCKYTVNFHKWYQMCYETCRLRAVRLLGGCVRCGHMRSATFSSQR